MADNEKAGYEICKGWLEVVRDAAILFIFGALLLQPKLINDRLTKAGFTKGSFFGLEWERALEGALQETREATESVASFEQQLQAAREELARLRASPAISAEGREQISRVSARIEKTTFGTSAVRDKLQKSLGTQEKIVREMQAKRRLTPDE